MKITIVAASSESAAFESITDGDVLEEAQQCGADTPGTRKQHDSLSLFNMDLGYLLACAFLVAVGWKAQHGSAPGSALI